MKRGLFILILVSIMILSVFVSSQEDDTICKSHKFCHDEFNKNYYCDFINDKKEEIGTCAPKLPGGKTCYDENQCLSGTCSGTCEKNYDNSFKCEEIEGNYACSCKLDSKGASHFTYYRNNIDGCKDLKSENDEKNKLKLSEDSQYDCTQGNTIYSEQVDRKNQLNQEKIEKLEKSIKTESLEVLGYDSAEKNIISELEASIKDSKADLAVHKRLLSECQPLSKFYCPKNKIQEFNLIPEYYSAKDNQKINDKVNEIINKILIGKSRLVSIGCMETLSQVNPKYYDCDNSETKQIAVAAIDSWKKRQGFTTNEIEAKRAKCLNEENCDNSKLIAKLKNGEDVEKNSFCESDPNSKYLKLINKLNGLKADISGLGISDEEAFA